jgi:hypothetical protein
VPDKQLLVELLPMAVPIGVVSVLTVVTLVAFATSSWATAAVIIAPLILGGWAYNKFISKRHRGPPRY